MFGEGKGGNYIQVNVLSVSLYSAYNVAQYPPKVTGTRQRRDENAFSLRFISTFVL